MANETVITVVGNLTADPELRFTKQGTAVANFTVASTARTFDKTRNEWVDGDPLFLRCSVWREYAEHVAASLTKGTRVIVQGNLKQRSWQDEQGNNRTVLELDVLEVAPSLRFVTAQITRTNSGGQQWGQSEHAVPGWAQAPVAPQAAAQAVQAAPQATQAPAAPQAAPRPGQAAQAAQPGWADYESEPPF